MEVGREEEEQEREQQQELEPQGPGESLELRWMVVTGPERRFFACSHASPRADQAYDVFLSCERSTYVMVGVAVMRADVRDVHKAWLFDALEKHRQSVHVTWEPLPLTTVEVTVKGTAYRLLDFQRDRPPGTVESLQRLVASQMDLQKFASKMARGQVERWRRIFETETATYRFLSEQRIMPGAHQHIYNTALRLRFKDALMAPVAFDEEWRASVCRAVETLYAKTGMRWQLATPPELEGVAPCRSLTPHQAYAKIKDNPVPLTREHGEWRDSRDRRRQIALLTELINHKLDVSWTATTGRRCDVTACVQNLQSYLFKQLVDYVTDAAAEPEQEEGEKGRATVASASAAAERLGREQVARALPQRLRWGGTPFLLMNDELLRTRRSVHYTVCSAPQLRKMTAQSLSEVFLPGQAFSVLNFDVDVKEFDVQVTARQPPPLAREKALTELERRADRGELARFLLQCLHDTAPVYLSSMSRTDGDREKLQGAGAKLEMNLMGKMHTYRRRSARASDKLSLRLVWHPPLELCFPDVQYLKAFLDRLKVFVRERAAAAGWVRFDWFDFAPFATRRSCRLAGARKGTGRNPDDVFSWQHTLNNLFECQGDGEAESLHTMAAGLSRQPVGPHRPTLGPPYTEFVLKNVWQLEHTFDAYASWTQAARSVALRQHRRWSADELTRVLGKLSALCCVPVDDLIVSCVGNGSETLAVRPARCAAAVCPVHGRRHRHATFEVRLVNDNVYPRCYHSDAPRVDGPYHDTQHYLKLVPKEGDEPLRLESFPVPSNGPSLSSYPPPPSSSSSGSVKKEEDAFDLETTFELPVHHYLKQETDATVTLLPATGAAVVGGTTDPSKRRAPPIAAHSAAKRSKPQPQQQQLQQLRLRFQRLEPREQQQQLRLERDEDDEPRLTIEVKEESVEVSVEGAEEADRGH